MGTTVSVSPAIVQDEKSLQLQRYDDCIIDGDSVERMREMFDKMDANKNGFLELVELKRATVHAAVSRHPASSRPISPPRPAWSSASGHLPSPTILSSHSFAAMTQEPLSGRFSLRMRPSWAPLWSG